MLFVHGDKYIQTCAEVKHQQAKPLLRQNE